MSPRPGIFGLLLCGAVCLTACSGRDPEYSEYDIAIPVIVRPADSSLVGKYELDNFSYDRVDATNAYPIKAILLEMRRDGSFRVANLPDMALGSNGKPKKGQLITAKGVWSIPVDPPSSNGGFVGFSGNIIFRITEGSVPGSPVSLTNQLTLRGKLPAISIPLGPPNGNQRLLFVKKSGSKGQLSD